MTAADDYYAVLGVERDADDKTIQRAYRKLARQFHPDLNKDPDAEARFKQINAANDVIGDATRRAKYDRLSPVLGDDWDRVPDDFDPSTLQAGVPGGAGFAPGGAGGGQWITFGSGDDADVDDLFANLFGRRPPRGPVRGADQEATIELPLADAYAGTETRLTLGDGARQRSFTARIPAGVTHAKTIRLRGKGGAGIAGGEPGDLFLHVRLAPDPRFVVDGRDVSTALRIAPWEAALGATVPVVTPTGEAKVKVPAGSSSGRRLKLSGRGIPNPGRPDAAGDLYAVLEIVVPSELDDRQRELFADLATASAGFDPRSAR